MDSSHSNHIKTSLVKAYSNIVITSAAITLLLGFFGLIATIIWIIETGLNIVDVNSFQSLFTTIGFWLLIGIVLPIAVLTYLFLGGVFSGLLAIPAAFMWNNPKRFVVLRRFQRDDTSKHLKQVLRKHVAPFGHVYTLADRDVKISRFVKYPLLLTQFAYLHFRPLLIKSKQDISPLLNKMSMKWLRNVNWLVSWSKVFPVNSSDDYWEQCVHSMCHLADVIICDVSEASAHIEWEIQQLINNDLVERTIFFTSRDKKTESQQFLTSLGIDLTKTEERIQCYDESDLASISTAITAILGSPLQSQELNISAYSWSKSIIQLIGPYFWAIFFCLMLLPISESILNQIQSSRSISVLVSDLNSNNDKTSELLELSQMLEYANPTQEESDNNGITTWLVNRIVNLSYLYQDGVIIDEIWLKEYDQYIVPLFLQIYGEKDEDDALVIEIIEFTNRPSAIPFWLMYLELNVRNRNSEALVKSINALKEYNVLSTKHAEVFTQALISRVNFLAINFNHREQNNSDFGLVLGTLAKINSPIAVKKVVETCSGSKELSPCRQLSSENAHYIFEALEKAWKSINYDQVDILTALRNLGLPDAREIWLNVIENSEGTYTSEKMSLAAEGIAEAKINDLASTLILKIDQVLSSHTIDDSDILLAKKFIVSLGQLKSKEILQTLYNIFNQKNNLQSRLKPAVKVALAEQLSIVLSVTTQQQKNINATNAVKKPLISVGTIGHVDHGKTTLTAAISAILTKTYADEAEDFTLIDNLPEERERGITIATSYIDYQSQNRRYKHIDSAGHIDLVKNISTGLASMDGAILVVAVDQRIQSQTREHLRLISSAGVKKVVVYLNKMDLVADPDLVELVETEIKELLDEYGYDGDETPIIKGSALLSLEGDQSKIGEPSILQLASAMDNHFQIPIKQTKRPFLMNVEGSGFVTNTSQMVAGRIEAGKLQKGDEVQLVGLMPTWKATVKDVIPLSSSESQQAGSTVAVLLEVNGNKLAKRGQIISEPNTVTSHTMFDAEVYILNKDEGGRLSPFFKGYKPQFYFRTTDIQSDYVELPIGVEMVMPGEYLNLVVTLQQPVALTEGLRFAIREGGRTVGAGFVVNIIE